MADIVVCGDLEGEIEKSGELSKLETLGSIEMFNEELWAMAPEPAARLMYDSLLRFCD